MKRNTILFTLSLLLLSCSIKNKKVSNPVIFVSIHPLKYFADRVVGDNYSVMVMIPPGTSPATWAPTPTHMRSLSDAKAYFSIGHLGFEKAWVKEFKKMNPNMRVIATSVDADLIKIVEQDHGDHVHRGIDPHVWVSPKQASVIAKNIFEGVASIDPKNRELYYQNLLKLLSDIDMVDKKVETSLTPISGKKFIIFHPSLGYLARDYGLEQIPIEFDGKLPSPSYMQHLVETAKAEDIKLVLIQKEFDIDNARSLANEINGTVVQVNPLDYDWAQQVIYISTVLSENLKDN